MNLQWDFEVRPGQWILRRNHFLWEVARLGRDGKHFDGPLTIKATSYESARALVPCNMQMLAETEDRSDDIYDAYFGAR